MSAPAFIQVLRGSAPLIVGIPHTGTDIPAEVEATLVSPWLARKDADWWVDRLYAFAQTLGATTVRTAISRTVIDVNRDPSGASLYPGQPTTELCPTTTFDGEPLYRRGAEPDEAEIERRLDVFFKPYHEAFAAEIERLRRQNVRVVVYDAHSIPSRVPRLFQGVLPHFNIGTNMGLTCAASLSHAIEAVCDRSDFTRTTDGRFKGGWTTRHYGRPDRGVHAVQMELACRAYMDEPPAPLCQSNWPPEFISDRAAPVQRVLTEILKTCIAFALTPETP